MTKLYSLAILAVVLAPASGQEKVPQHLLRLSFAGTEPQWFRVQQEMTASMVLDGKAQTQRIRLDVFWKTRVERSADAGVVVVHSLARLRGAGRDAGGRAYSYDSATDAGAPMEMREFAGLQGTEIRVTVDPQGRVRRLELPQMLKDLDDQSGVAVLKASDMIRPLDLELPELPVAVGQTWPGSNDRALVTSDDFVFDSEYSLLSVAEGVARIEQRFAMTAAADEKQERPEGGGEERSLGRRAHRTFTLDLRTGRVVGVEERATITAKPSDKLPKVRMTLTSQRTARATVEPGEDLEPLEPPGSEPGREKQVEVPAPATSRPTASGKNKLSQK